MAHNDPEHEGSQEVHNTTIITSIDPVLNPCEYLPSSMSIEPRETASTRGKAYNEAHWLGT